MPPGALRIGLSARLMHRVPAELGFRDKKLQYLETSIAHWVMAHGALAVMLPTLLEGGSLDRRSIRVSDYVRELDGLILQGGADVSPTTYGGAPLRPEWAGDSVRDRYEIELFWEFMIQCKPVLGICRGCQLINVALGGTLWQDLPSQYEGIARHNDFDLYDTLEHDIAFVQGSSLAAIYGGAAGGRVNSIHHQAVRELGKDLRIEARSVPDGVVESIRWKGDGFVVGVQWHPEFHSPHDERRLRREPLMEAFLQAAAGARRRAGEGPIS